MITGLRKGEIGLLVRFLDGRLAGFMESMRPSEMKNLFNQLHVISEDNMFRQIEPIKCRVKFRNLTKAGFLRIPSFVEWG